MPYPRGELLVKTSTMISGYWNRPDLNDQIFDDGWYKTGFVFFFFCFFIIFFC